MEPLSTTRVQRPFHWGLVVLVGGDWTGDYPEVDPDAPVTASDRVLLVPVRHAQDSDEFDGEYLKHARAEVVVRRWGSPPTPQGPLQEVYRGLIQLPAGNLTVGDADEWVTIPVNAGINEVWVSYDDGASRDNSPERVWVDLAPASVAGPARKVVEAPFRAGHDLPVGRILSVGNGTLVAWCETCG